MNLMKCLFFSLLNEINKPFTSAGNIQNLDLVELVCVVKDLESSSNLYWIIILRGILRASEALYTFFCFTPSNVKFRKCITSSVIPTVCFFKL